MTEKTAGTIRSYSSGSVSVLAFVREACSLYRYSQKSSERARSCIDDMRRREALVDEHLGLDLHDLDILEIGPGQFQGQTRLIWPSTTGWLASIWTSSRRAFSR